MTIDELIENDAITFTNFRSDLSLEEEAVEISNITSALNILWNNDEYRTAVLDKIDSTEGNTLSIRLGENIAKSTYDVVIIDSQYSFTYLDNAGAAHTSSFLRILAHEVMHAVLDTNDTIDDLTGGQIDPDYLGETVIATNTYMETIDFSAARASYSATGDFLASEHNGQWLPDGVTADVVLVAQDGSGAGTTRPGPHVDTSNNVDLINDLIIGWNGSNTITTGAGDDYIYGRGGVDTINGGTGNDWIDGGGGGDAINGGAGQDVVFFDPTSGGVTINLKNETGSGGDAAGDSYSNIEVFIGTDSADRFNAAGVQNVKYLAGGGGADVFDMTLADPNDQPGKTMVVWGGRGGGQLSPRGRCQNCGY